VLEGLKGWPIGELCAEHEISQAQATIGATSSWPTPRKRSSRPRRDVERRKAFEAEYFGHATPPYQRERCAPV
jgi:hypothetical protein